LIHRDGSVTAISLTGRSGVYEFDVEARGSIESVANAHGFGPLPTAFADDVLSVVFSFDTKTIRR
jgi:hypothetical protein